jgi:hypothetical protein
MSTIDARTPGERALPLAGAAFTGLTVLAAVVFPMPPGGDVSAASNPDWLAAHYNAVIAQSYVRALGALAFIVLAVAVGAACRRTVAAASSLPRIAIIGGALSGTLLLLSHAVGLAAALYTHDAGAADTTRALGALQNGFLDLSSLPAVLMFAAVGVASLRTGLLPRWLTVFTLVGVPFAVLDAISYDGGALEPVGFLGLIYFLAWALFTGVRLYTNGRNPMVPVTRAEPATAS